MSPVPVAKPTLLDRGTCITWELLPASESLECIVYKPPLSIMGGIGQNHHRVIPVARVEKVSRIDSCMIDRPGDSFKV